MYGGFVYVLSIGVCAGIAFALLFGIGIVMAGVLWVSAILLLFFFVFFRRQNKTVLMIVIVLCAVALGLARTAYFLDIEQKETLVQQVNQTATVTGTVVNDPDRRETSLRAVVRVQTVNGEHVSADRQGILLAVLPRETILAYGDKVEVKGKISAPKIFETDTGHLFDYPAYLRAQDSVGMRVSRH